MMRTRKLAMLFAAAFSVFAFGAPAQACKCGNFSRTAAIEAADVAFEGRVLSVRTEGRRRYADVEMIRPLKGAVPRRIEVGTNVSSAACGYPFKAGQRLSFAANFREQQFSTGMCLMMPMNNKGGAR